MFQRRIILAANSCQFFWCEKMDRDTSFSIEELQTIIHSNEFEAFLTEHKFKVNKKDCLSLIFFLELEYEPKTFWRR